MSSSDVISDTKFSVFILSLAVFWLHFPKKVLNSSGIFTLIYAITHIVSVNFCVTILEIHFYF